MADDLAGLVNTIAESFAVMNDYIAAGDWFNAREENNSATTLIQKLPWGGAIRQEAMRSVTELTILIAAQESAAAGTVTARIVQFLRNAEFAEIQEGARVVRNLLPEALTDPEGTGFGFGFGLAVAAVAVTAVVAVSVIATIKFVR